jgi:hypothetical protein
VHGAPHFWIEYSGELTIRYSKCCTRLSPRSAP